MNRGEALWKVVTEVGGMSPEQHRGSMYLLSRTAGRFIEEATELALAHGLTPAQILMHVSDALSNECRKESRDKGYHVFPSTMSYRWDAEEQAVELGDVQLLIDYLAELGGHGKERIENQADAKLKLLQLQQLEGKLIVEDGLLYRKMAYS